MKSFTKATAVWRCTGIFLLGISAAVLTACGGGDDAAAGSPAAKGSIGGAATGDGGVGAGGPKADPTANLPPFPNFASALGFFDVTRANQPRPIRNDLAGALPGMVQFVQSHSINPKGNTENNLPTLVTSRNALLLFTPQRSPAGKVRVEVQVDGVTQHTVVMATPNQLPATDVTGTDGRPDVAYTKRAWSTVLPWTVVKPGMALVFRDESGQFGTLVASQIEMAAPAKMYIWGIRLGMLTSPPIDNDGQPMLTKPALAATDYFQLLPVSQLTVASYEDVKLDKVMLADGTILTGASKSNGDYHGGDMREQVGKSQFSIGINLANYGVSSSINGDQSIGETTPQIVYHHSAGNYANGVQVHGGSGGGAMATLSTSYGNEFSHELGHHYGMGHFPGQVGNDGFWANHHADSGWGYIDHRKRMRSNLMWSAKERDPGAGTVNPQSFAHQYIYQKDPMSGAWLEPDSMLSRYTYYTGYTATRIQKFMDKAWFDQGSATGYSRWDVASQKVVPATPGDDRAPPTRFGVPVFTLLGAYDPSNNTAVMYPPARANYGMVFDKLPAPDAAASAACWIDVRFANGSKSINLHADRIRKDSTNKFHVNIAEADQPQSASLSCRKGDRITRLAEVVFPQNLPAMAAAVVVGESAGYEALAAREMPQIEAALKAIGNDKPPFPDSNLRLLLDSWRDRLPQLSGPAAETWKRIERTRISADALNDWMTNNAAGLDAKAPETVKAWRARLVNSGLVSGTGGYADAFSQVVMGRSEGCMAVSSGDPLTAKAVVTPCVRKPEQLWVQDARGALRSAALPDYCIRIVDDWNAGLAKCNRDSAAQIFTVKDGRIVPITRPWIGLKKGVGPDDGSRLGQLGAYNTSWGVPQWHGLKQDPNMLLALLSDENARRLLQLDPVK
ncbi:M66 family metalloprotease [Burkholderia sp. BKH01]|uniref:M66 family metalloprotease n=1 Tax=Burkholderia sp. BKH01 TaxID=2769262 RepID=UPI0021E07ADA|nr:M66 family metalloprotease [Burkholderia sp. BKH01]MCU9951925.1 M66 family metalloprotease [Burkholderia sp. BKH01]